MLLLGVFGLSSVDSKSAIVAYYNFDAQTSADNSGTGNNGTVLGATFSSSERPAALTGSTHSIFFDGTDDRVNIPHSTSLAFTGGIASVSLWMKSTTGDTDQWLRPISKGTDPGFQIQRFQGSSDGRLRVDTTSLNNQEATIGALWNATWNHVAFTLDNGVRTVWLNGVKTTGNYTGTNFSSTSQLVLGDTDGANENNREFGGWLDDVAIWDHAITDSDIAGLFAGTTSPLAVVPEVSSCALVTLGGLLLFRRRRA